MTSSGRELTLDEKNFQSIAELAYRESGLQLMVEKTSMIQSRLRHRLRAVGMDSFDVYTQYVCSTEGAKERRHMISALTTNVSHFFREVHHFNRLQDNIIPGILPTLKSGNPVRIWSAGCSNGQEAFSIAMTFLNSYPEIGNTDFRILATDIDPNVVKFAQMGEYPSRLISGVPKDNLEKFFIKREDNQDQLYKVHPKVKNLVTFKELNLLSTWPMKQQFDIIFCRNVVIYFDQKTQDALWPRFRSSLKPSGVLFLGHSERIVDPESLGFTNDGATTYRPSQNKDQIN